MLIGLFVVAEGRDNSKAELERVSEQCYMLIYKYCNIRLESQRAYSYDITNEVFILLCEKWDGLKKENIKAWLYRTADHKLKEFFRKHKKKLREVEYIDDLDDYTVDNLAYEQDFDNMSDIDIEAYRDEILEGLSDEEKELYDMVFTEKLSYSEICDELLISRETLKKRLYRLRQKIKEAVYISVASMRYRETRVFVCGGRVEARLYGFRDRCNNNYKFMRSTHSLYLQIMNQININMNIKISIVKTLIICLIFALIVSCNYESETLVRKIPIEEIPIDTKYVSYTAFVDNSIIYLNLKTSTYYRYYIHENRLVTLGTIDNFLLSTKNSVLIDNKLYFYINVLLNENTSSNVLLEIDLTTNEIKMYENSDNSLAGISTYKFNTKVVTIKNVVSDDIITTYLEMFDTITKTWYVRSTNIFNKSTQTGSAIHGVYGTDDNLYVLYDECLGKSNIITTLKVYDNDLNEIQTISLNQETYDYIMKSRVMEIAVFGEYIYVQNVSNEAILGKITNDSISLIMKEQNLTLALNQEDSNNPFFYIRRTKKCYTLNSETEDITEINLKIDDDDYSIMCILSDKDNIFLVCYADDKMDCVYFINKTCLNSVNISCES